MLFLSDLHLDCFKQWSTLRDGMNTRLLDQIEVIDRVGKLIRVEGVSNVIFLGDMINSFSDSLPKIVYSAVWYALRSWTEAGANVWIVVGNHDIYRGMHIFDPYRDMPGVNIISNSIHALPIEGYSIDMIPWGNDIPSEKADILASHIVVKGARMNSAGKCTTDGIDAESMVGYKYVFLGHYHELQTLNVPGTLWAGYVGAVIQPDLSDSPFNRGVTILDDKGVRNIDIPSPRIYAATIPTQEEANSITTEIEKGNYWRLTVTDPLIELPTFDHRVQVEYDIVHRIESRLEAKNDENLLQTAERFIDKVDTKVDKDLAKKLLREIGI